MLGKHVFYQGVGGDIFDKMACVFKSNPAINIDSKDCSPSSLDDISSVSKS